MAKMNPSKKIRHISVPQEVARKTHFRPGTHLRHWELKTHARAHSGTSLESMISTSRPGPAAGDPLGEVFSIVFPAHRKLLGKPIVGQGRPSHRPAGWPAGFPGIFAIATGRSGILPPVDSSDILIAVHQCNRSAKQFRDSDRREARKCTLEIPHIPTFLGDRGKDVSQGGVPWEVGLLGAFYSKLGPRPHWEPYFPTTPLKWQLRVFYASYGKNEHPEKNHIYFRPTGICWGNPFLRAPLLKTHCGRGRNTL